MSRDYLKGSLFFLLATVIFLSCFWQRQMGTVGEYLMGAFLNPLFNKAALLVSLYCFVLGVSYFIKQFLRSQRFFIICVSLFFISILFFIEMLVDGRIDTFNFSGNKDLGIIAYLISFIMQKLIGLVGFYLSVSVMAMMSALGIVYSLKFNKKNNFYPEKTKSDIKRTENIVEKKIVLPKQTQKTTLKTEDKTQTVKKIKINRKQGVWTLPPLDLLPTIPRKAEDRKQLEQEAIAGRQKLAETLESFKINAAIVNVSVGPSVMRYELKPAAGTKVNKISNLADDISLALAKRVRIEAPVPNRSVVGIEVPRESCEVVSMKQMVTDKTFYQDILQCALGLDIGGKPHYCNIQDMPHLLIAGATGSGKSVFINTLIISMMMKATPEQLKFLMIDPKRVELTPYNNIPHLISPVINDPQLSSFVLKNWALKEMEQRYSLFAKIGVRNISGYNKYAEKNYGKVIDLDNSQYQIKLLPIIVIVIDELADLMMTASKEVEVSIARLSQMARATGIHLIVATQRPSVDVITGLIKANVPSRVTFAVGSQVDSRTIIDVAGAEKLLGRGDMLYSPVGQRHLLRLQGVFLSDNEIADICRFWKEQGTPNYEVDLEKIAEQMRQKDDPNDSRTGGLSGDDDLIEEALEVLRSTDRRSISYLQRKLRIGYNRAARIMEEIEERGLL